MPDKTIGQLPNLTSGVSADALFIMEQDETAYNLTGEQLEEWLTTMNYGYTSSSSYVASSSGTDIPQSGWSSTVPSVNQGQFLWTKTELTFGTGSPVNIYSNARQGVDGTGTPGTSTPLALAASGAVGTSTSFARQDHVHPFGSALVNLIYPVGSIYLSVNNTNPGSWLGGTWEQIQDKFLLAAGSTYAGGTSGGSADAVVPYHTHTEEASGAHTIANLALGANPNAASSILGSGDGVTRDATGDTRRRIADTSYTNTTTTLNDRLTIAAHSHTINYAGTSGNTAGANMPPYLAVYVWKRTA